MHEVSLLNIYTLLCPYSIVMIYTVSIIICFVRRVTRGRVNYLKSEREEAGRVSKQIVEREVIEGVVITIVGQAID